MRTQSNEDLGTHDDEQHQGKCSTEISLPRASAQPPGGNIQLQYTAFSSRSRARLTLP